MFVKSLLLALIFASAACARLGLDNLDISGVKPTQQPMQVRWAKNLDPVFETGNLPIHLGAPVIEGERLFMADGSGRMSAYALENGRELWQQEDNGSSHAGVLVAEDKLYYGTSEGRFFSRLISDGQLLWAVDLGAAVESKATLAGGRLFVHLRNHQIFALDAQTGKILWAYKRSVPLLTTLQKASAPVVSGNRLYVGFADGNVVAFNVEEGVLLWERKISVGDKFIDVDMTPTFFHNELWVGSSSNDLHVLDPKTGRTIRTVDLISSHSPLKYGEVLIYGTHRGEIVAVNRLGKITLRYAVSKNQISSVNQWKEGFAVTDVEGNLFYVSAQDGNILWQKHLGHSASGIFAKPAVSATRFALLSSRHRLYVFY
jgi:outer membrane protein assembly factor BamB